MLLLDEPTNHLDAESVEWLEQFLVRFPGTVVAVTHDRYFLDNAAEWILELDRGQGIPWKGNYSSWLEQKEARLETEGRQEAGRIKAMKQELEWVRQNPNARQAKSTTRLSLGGEYLFPMYGLRGRLGYSIDPSNYKDAGSDADKGVLSLGMGVLVDRSVMLDLTWRTSSYTEQVTDGLKEDIRSSQTLLTISYRM